MWYQLHDANAKLWRSANSFWQQLDQTVFNNGFARNLPPSRIVSAYIQGADRVFKEYNKPEFGIEQVTDEKGQQFVVQQTVVMDLPFCRLLAFTKVGTDPTKKPREVFIVAPLSGHYATLLRDMVARMTADADIVWITDWKNARDVPLAAGNFSFSDYVKYVESFLQSLGRRVHVVAVCQPAVPVLAAASRMAEHNDPMRPLSLILMGGPIDARKSPTLVDSYATKNSIDWFRQRVIDTVPFGYAGAGRRVYPGFLQHFGFMAMNPQKHKKAYQDLVNNLISGNDDSVAKHIAFYDEYNAVLDLDAHFYLDTIEQVFQKFTLAEGTMVIDNEVVKPECIVDIAVFTIEGEKDDIAGVGQTKAALTLCSALENSRKRHLEVPGVGHYGIFSGSTFRAKTALAMFEWMDKAQQS